MFANSVASTLLAQYQFDNIWGFGQILKKKVISVAVIVDKPESELPSPN